MAGTTDDEGDAELTANPGGMFAGQGDPENGKSKDWIQGAGMGGTAAQDHADRRGKAGKGMVDKGGPLEGSTDTPSQ
ncbi:hypothetical protein [Rubellimicrobium arenae]|uniref:hypothetical protein n=1 Tax=Rubellimicrobium arenae TaxID=2817372 RepID=UPI001B304844|nr:hypothetical protein [Rubellimicrobium arenae]